MAHQSMNGAGYAAPTLLLPAEDVLRPACHVTPGMKAPSIASQRYSRKLPAACTPRISRWLCFHVCVKGLLSELCRHKHHYSSIPHQSMNAAAFAGFPLPPADEDALHPLHRTKSSLMLRRPCTQLPLTAGNQKTSHWLCSHGSEKGLQCEPCQRKHRYSSTWHRSMHGAGYAGSLLPPVAGASLHLRSLETSPSSTSKPCSFSTDCMNCSDSCSNSPLIG